MKNNIVKLQSSVNASFEDMLKVVLIEHDEILRDILSRMLRKLGHAVFEFDDGDSIFDKVNSISPDLIITDILLPNRDGVKLISSLRRDYPELPIIAISESRKVGNIDYLELAINFGANEAIEKPILYSKFIKTVEDVVSLSKQGWVSC